MDKGLTQEKLARKVHVAQSTISSIENGVRIPSIALARRLGAALEFDWTLLFNDDQGNKTIDVRKDDRV